MPETIEGFRVPDVLKLVGITYRQLDYWARTGLVTPSVREAGGSGTQRLYSFNDILQLRLIKRLEDTGASLQKIRTALSNLGEVLQVAPEGATLVSDGATIYAIESADQIVDLLRKGQGVFAIDLDQVRSELQDEVRKAERAARRAAGGA